MFADPAALAAFDNAVFREALGDGELVKTLTNTNVASGLSRRSIRKGAAG